MTIVNYEMTKKHNRLVFVILDVNFFVVFFVSGSSWFYGPDFYDFVDEEMYEKINFGKKNESNFEQFCQHWALGRQQL